MASLLNKTIRVSRQSDIDLVDHSVRITRFANQDQGGNEEYNLAYTTTADNAEFTINREVNGPVGSTYFVTCSNIFTYKGQNIFPQVSFSIESI